MPHWTDSVVDEIISVFDKQKSYAVECGWTPSGYMHIGNTRDILTADFVYKALIDRGYNAEFVFVADDFDAFFEMPSFLRDMGKEKEYENYLGIPLCKIPDPFECCESYADHFLKVALEPMKDFDIHMKLVRDKHLYQHPKAKELIRKVLNNIDEVKKIFDDWRIEPGGGWEGWSPYNPLCENCNRLLKKEEGTTLQVKVLEHYPDEYKMKYHCEICGHDSIARFDRGEGKFRWRFDWPTHWAINNVVAEPLGKDHGSIGSSYDTGKDIVERIFGRPGPVPIIYDFIVSHTGGKMSGRKGTGFSFDQWKEIALPELLRYLYLRYKITPRHPKIDSPSGAYRPFSTFSHVSFEIQDVPNLLRGFYSLEKAYFKDKDNQTNRRDYSLSLTMEKQDILPVQIPFYDILLVSQTPMTENEIINYLREKGKIKKENLTEIDKKRLENLIITTRNWVGEIPEIINQKINDIITILRIDSNNRNVVQKSIETASEFSEWYVEMLGRPWCAGIIDDELLYLSEITTEELEDIEKELFDFWSNNEMEEAIEKFVGNKDIVNYWKDLRDRFKKDAAKFEDELNKIREKGYIELPTTWDTFLNRLELVMDFEDKISKLKTLFEDYKFTLNIWSKYGALWVDEISPELLSKIKFSGEEIKELYDFVKNEDFDEKQLESKMFGIANTSGLKKRFFEDLYLIFIGKNQGPRLAPYLCRFPKDKIIERLKDITEITQSD